LPENPQRIAQSRLAPHGMRESGNEDMFKNDADRLIEKYFGE
jgi:hypothetical protein